MKIGSQTHEALAAGRLRADLPLSLSATDIVNAMVATAHGLDQRVVAVGVEKENRVELLNASHCDQGHRYLFAASIPATDIPTHLQSTKELTDVP